MLLMLIAMETATPDPLPWLVNYGIAGIVIALIVMGRVRTKAEVDGLTAQLEQTRADLIAERAANAALVAQVTHHTLPQIAGLSEVLDRLQAVQKGVQTDVYPTQTGHDLTTISQRLDQITATLARLDSTPNARGEGS